VAAFARPVSRLAGRRVTGTGVHRILLVDTSYSLGAASDSGATAWEQARRMMDALVRTWGRGERWSLYILDDQPRWLVDDQPVETAEQTAATVAGLQLSESSARLAPALETVLARAAGQPAEIYVVADGQALTWKDVDRVALPVSSEPLRLFWLRPGVAKTGNLAVEQVLVSQERPLVGHPCRVFAHVRNYGADAAQDVEVEFLVDGAFFGKERISLLAGQDAWTWSDVYFNDPGPHAVTARLQDRALAFDNRFSAGLHAVRSLRVCVLRDAGKQGKFESAAGFLDLLANVMQREDPYDGPFFPHGRLVVSVSDADGPGAVPADADVVVLDGGRALQPSLVEALRAYVDNGGGLVLAADNTVNISRWNDALGDAGLLPARLGPVRNEPLGGERSAHLARTGFAAPALRPFEDLADGDISHVRFYSWVELGDPAPEAQVLARFGSGRPYAVLRRNGLGAVLLLAGGLNSLNNNLLARETAYPLVTRLFAAAAAGRQFPLTVRRRAPIRLSLPGPAPTAVQLEAPGMEPLAIEPVARGPAFLVSLASGAPNSGLASTLVVRGDDHERVWIGVQGERIDSDLSPLAPAAVGRLEERLGIVPASSWEELDARLAATRRGREWYHWAVIALLCLLTGEMWMQRRFV
jgi:hypothetical protein